MSRDLATPRPWAAQDRILDISIVTATDRIADLPAWFDGRDDQGRALFSAEGHAKRLANADLIVCAVNAHDDLVAALLAVLAVVEVGSFAEVDAARQLANTALAKARS